MNDKSALFFAVMPLHISRELILNYCTIMLVGVFSEK